MTELRVVDVGRKPYLDVLRLQEEFFNKNITDKLSGHHTQNFLILCEHEPVFTLGKSGKRENILVNDAEMGAEFYRVNRGGDVTFHGYGQLVAYPILDLDLLKIGLVEYIFLLEETIIESIKNFGLKGERIDGAAGIWLRNPDRKIGAIGVKASRNITMHGIAVNVNTDLNYFKKIRACGLEGKETTSLENELKSAVALTNYKQNFLSAFGKIFTAVTV